jgi:hypothetical protein
MFVMSVAKGISHRLGGQKCIHYYSGKVKPWQLDLGLCGECADL